MKDRLTLGLCAGAVAQAIKFAIGFPLHLLFGWPKFGDANIAAGIFLTREAATSEGIGFLFGVFLTLVIGGILGTILVYVLTVTGSDRWQLKGPAMGLLYYIAFWGILTNLHITKVIPTDLGSNVFNLIFYPLWGYMAATFAVRWGDESLFRGVPNLE